MSNRIIFNRKKMAIFTVYLLMSASMAVLVFASVTGNDDLGIKDSNRVYIDTDFDDDRASRFDYTSSTRSRIISIDNDLDNQGDSYSINNLRDEVKIKDISIRTKTNSQGINEYVGDIRENMRSSGSSNDRSRIHFSNNDLLEVQYISTINGIKEIVVLKSRPNNATEDMIIQSKLDLSRNLEVDSESNVKDFSNVTIQISNKREGRLAFSIPTPLMWDTPKEVIIDSRPLHINDNNLISLDHRARNVCGEFIHEVLIPLEILETSTFPLYIDPTITSFDGYSEYIGYDNGTVRYIDGSGNECWYPDVNNEIYLESDLNIGPGEFFGLTNVKLLYNVSNCGITVSGPMKSKRKNVSRTNGDSSNEDIQGDSSRQI